MSRTEFEADKKHRELINGSCVDEVMITLLRDRGCEDTSTLLSWLGIKGKKVLIYLCRLCNIILFQT